MIIVKIMAGLGNQMFQYATGKRLADRLGSELKLDITSYENMHPDDTPRYFELDYFKINARPASAEELARVMQADYERSLPEKIAHRLGQGSAIYQYGERGAHFDPKVLSLRDNTYLVGWWQNENY